MFFVGYDKDGWFWEYKSPTTSTWYRGSRVAAPETGSTNRLSITLKSDGQLNASNNDVNLFDTVTLPAAVNDHLKMRRRSFSRRALMAMTVRLSALKQTIKKA